MVNESQNVAENVEQPDVTPDGVDSQNAELGAEHAGAAASSPAEENAAAELDGLRQQLLRTHADFDNFRKRTRQEKEDLQRFATKKLLGELLPVADNFERAMASFNNSAGVEEVKTGLDMVWRQLLQVFQQNGVEAIDPRDLPFDPNYHEAVMQEPADGKEVGIVTQVLQKGYVLHGKVLRPAMVKVTV